MSWSPHRPGLFVSNCRNSNRRSSSNSSSMESRQAAVNSRYSQELSPFTSKAFAVFFARSFEMPTDSRAALRHRVTTLHAWDPYTSSGVSRTPLLSVSNVMKSFANLSMHVQFAATWPLHEAFTPPVALRQKALWQGDRSLHVSTAAQSFSKSSEDTSSHRMRRMKQKGDRKATAPLLAAFSATRAVGFQRQLVSPGPPAQAARSVSGRSRGR